MLARSSTAALAGIEAYPVQVEVDLAPGLPALVIVGLADAAVQESRERVRSARSGQQLLSVARTIADLDGDVRVGSSAVAEALTYRSFAP